MVLDTRWKNPQGKDPEALWRWAQDLIAELRRGDYLPDTPDAAGIAYGNGTSGLTAGDVQAAIDEVEGRIDVLEAGTGTAVTTFQSTQQTITSAGSLTLAHGLGAKPQLVTGVLQNLTAEANYSIGDEIMFPAYLGFAGGLAPLSRGIAIVPDATNLNIRFGSSANAFDYLNKTTGVLTALTNANWALVARAWRFG